MPTYEFRNKKTGEVTEQFFSFWTDRDEYLAANPHLETTMTRPPQINADPIGGNQHGKAFREVLNKIHKTTPGSTLNKTAEL